LGGISELRSGDFREIASLTSDNGAEGCELVLESGDQKLTGQSVAAGSWATCLTRNLGQLKFEKKGLCMPAVKPKVPPEWKVIGLKAVVLTPRAGLHPQ